MNQKPLAKLSFTKDTVRRLIDSELEKVQGGAICETRVCSGCSTGTMDKCQRDRCYTGTCGTTGC